MKRLIVYLNGERTGSLDEDDSGQIEFRYASAWIGRPGAMPLSRSLPLQSETFRGRHARPFFAGILPDEGQRQQIAAIFGISARNDFAMLERIADLCGKCIDGLRREKVLGASPDAATAKRVAGIIGERASSLLRSLSSTK